LIWGDLMTYDSIDRNIIGLLQGDLPLVSHPFQKLAQSLNISEQEIVDRVRALQQNGMVRRWGAVLRHQKAGYSANAMVAWKVENERAEEVGRIMAEFKEISHCYLRDVPDLFEYNLFAMLHAHNDDELNELVTKVCNKTNSQNYKVIKSLKEFKKASLEYV